LHGITDLHPLAYVGILLLAGFVGGKIANRLNAPRVTGYLVAGMCLSPSALGVLDQHAVEVRFALITDLALAVIAFSIGGTLALRKLKRLGGPIFWIALAQSCGALVVSTALISWAFPGVSVAAAEAGAFWDVHFPLALVIGAIGAATAPAPILAIVHEYRAKGPLTTVLLGVVALDDALAILFFAFAVGLGQSLMAHQLPSWWNSAVLPLASILLSVALGGGVGLCLKGVVRLVARHEAMLGVVLGVAFLTAGLASSLGVSPLLAAMTLGFVVANFVKGSHDLFGLVESIEEPIFAIFFTFAGAHLDLRLVQTAGLLALFVIGGRFAGKLLGAWVGARISRAPRQIGRYLGYALLPKAGVTVGLVLMARDVFGDSPVVEIMINAVLASVVINELIAPFLVRIALRKAGEVEVG
jgi:Kef-type K+ transport system membrane component KefB